ncbi:MAG: 4-diphosphocytidyl-2-C-methyl-D-erythritol kinase [Solirubrobacteraceae bacterium]|jgi:4-diphosphocytidyl-2-C-methyl-D-erythritol kinase|nr:4-diphosphocytidyl-2-C-methyl-D-erythritol kinase [Solirubrobacteraceae bacterium]
MTELSTQARAKINLCLFVGPRRGDGRHQVVTLMDSLDIHDDVCLQVAPGGLRADEVVCPGVEGPNLAEAALAAFRARTGWDAPPVRLQITKRVPVAGGMAGGSADAAAALRLAAEAAEIDDHRLLEDIASELGADVPSQIRGGLMLATGEGTRLRPLPLALDYSVVVLPVAAELATRDVYAEADRLGLARDALGLARSLTSVQAAISAESVLDHVHNDLQDAARSLCPPIDDALEAAITAGADTALVSGSGPTVLALFFEVGHRERAATACEALVAERGAQAPILATPSGPIG